jgi:hypothetical protein
MSKYEPLRRHLNSLRHKRYRMSFAEVERILKFKLPKSALSYPAWWSNDPTGHSHAKAWLDAGWRTENVDVVGRKVTLVRNEAHAPRMKTDPWGCMAGTVRIMPGTDLTAPAGEVWTAEDGRILSE